MVAVLKSSGAFLSLVLVGTGKYVPGDEHGVQVDVWSWLGGVPLGLPWAEPTGVDDGDDD